MNIKVLINAILVILLLHLLIKNINFNKVFTIGNKNIKENFHQTIDYLNLNNLKDYANEHKKTMEFLLDTSPPTTNNNKDTKCYNDLIDYVNKCDKNDIKAGNFYVEDENSANFMSNVLNVNKFYDKNDLNKVPGSYDGLGTSELQNLNEKYNPNFLNKVEDQTCFPKRNLQDNNQLFNSTEFTKDNTTVFKPDNWNYKNELPMNGGTIVGNVVGFDSLNTGYSTYDDRVYTVSKNCQNDVDCNQEPDDIRFGLGYPNRETD